MKRRNNLKRQNVLKRRRFFGMLLILAIGVTALCLFFALIHIGGLSIEYSEAYYQGDTYWANRVFAERQAIGAGTGLMAFLYNLPFVLKLILFLVSGALSLYFSCCIYSLYKASKKTKKSVRAQLYKYHLQNQMKRSW